MGLFNRRTQPFPQWVRFSSGASYAEAERIGLGPGDGISVLLDGREVGMDLMVMRPDSFTVKDPDGTSHLHEWHEAVSFWRRIA